MKISIVIAVLDSHEIVRRQILHFEKMNLPSDVEIIFVDDGSDPPIEKNGSTLQNFTILYTHDKRPWTQPIARNMGCRAAQGEWLILTDMDHILSKDLIHFVYWNTEYDVIRFRREAGVIDEHGDFYQNAEILIRYGLLPSRIPDRGFRLPPHSNSMAIKRKLFWEIGGMPEDRIIKYPNRDETPLRRAIERKRRAGRVKVLDGDGRPVIYMIPNGQYCGTPDFNPFNLFHNLPRIQECET